MNRYATFFRRQLPFFLIPLLVGIIYFGSTVLSSSAKKSQAAIKIHNLTRFFEVTNAEGHNGHVKVTVQNNSNQAITAFILTVPIDPRTSFTFTQEFAFSENDTVIPPGQSYDVVMGIPGSLSSQPEIMINVAAVIYEDSSAEGNPDTIQDVKDKRLGEKIQLTRTIPFLEKMLALSDSELQSSFIDFQTAVTSALSDSETNMSAQPEEQSRQSNNRHAERRHLDRIKGGLQTGQESVLRQFRELGNLQQSARRSALREEIIRIKQRYERIISKI